jgi:putative redox protein
VLGHLPADQAERGSYAGAVVTATLGPTNYTTTVVAGGHTLVADEAVSAGGADAGTNPLSMLLAALASCTAITLRMYAERKGWDAGDIEVQARFVAGSGDGHVDRTITLTGTLDDAQRQRLGEIAARTPVTRIVAEGREIRTTVR